MRLCPECHKEVPDSALICPYCESPRLMDGTSDAEILKADDPVVRWDRDRRRVVRKFSLLGGLCGAIFVGFLALGLHQGTPLGTVLFGGRRPLILAAVLSAVSFFYAWDRYQEGREDYSKGP
jgi:hypothetical protein